MSEPDKTTQYRIAEALIAEQNIVNGTAAAIIAAFASALAWGAITVATGYMIGFVAIGVGIAVGYGMQVFGKGIAAKFGIVAAVLAVIGCMLGNLAGALMFEMRAYGVGIGEIIETLTLDDLIAFYTETLEIMDLIFWVLAVGAAWQFAPRKLTEEETMAVHAWENRPEQGAIS